MALSPKRAPTPATCGSATAIYAPVTLSAYSGHSSVAQSVPAWAAYNVDYDELKNLIKVNTTKDQGQAIAIPGHADRGLEKFENFFLNELSNQHDRVGLFVKSKADEVSRRLQYLQKNVLRLLARTSPSTACEPTQRQLEKFTKYNSRIERCGDDIRSLQRFVSAQRTAFHKILKKYKPQPQEYWNEYDNGSEASDEPYHIYINPDESFPGVKTIEYVFSKVKRPMESVKSWFTPGTSPSEQRPLVAPRDTYFNDQSSLLDTDPEDDAYASTNEFPAGYKAHYATFPSINDQKFSRHREMLLFRGMVGSFAGSLTLIFITSILFATGRRKLMAEVDAGAVTGCIASLCAAFAGISAALCRKETLGWLHRSCVWVAFVGLLTLNLMLLFLVLSNLRS
ncbi:hypothetical protein PZA11_003788 [Diplocarpon coronariae]